MSPVDLKALYRRKTNFVSRKVDGELVLVPLKNNIAEMKKLFTLNEVGAFIWNLIDDKNSVEGIVERVIEEFDIDVLTARKDTEDFLGQLEGNFS